jgi:urease subunit gamma/beta
LDKLVLHQVGALAQKRLARGVRLNYPEAVGLIAAQLLEFIRDGRGVAELMQLGRQLLGRRQVMEGVAELISEVQVEGTFPDGTKLVTVHHPIVREDGEMRLALYGSFLPCPDLAVFGESPVEERIPGEVRVEEGSLTMNEGREAVHLRVTNLGDRPVQVGSHFHFIEVNAALEFDRGRAYGRRLDIPAGTAVRFEPGETRSVGLVEIDGHRVISGGNGLGAGRVCEEGRVAALERVQEKKFAHREEAVCRTK